ncbi:MAG: hypothetical protein AB1679_33585 [Actinomycetota bacterium]|jgi:hypothetical protein
MSDAPDQAVQLSVVTPATWITLDLDPATRNDSIARVVQQRIGSGPNEESRRIELRAAFERVMAEAEGQDAVHAALLSDVIEGVPVAASLIVSLREGQSASASAGLNPAVVAQGLRQALDGKGAAEVRELPLGPAVQVRQRVLAQVPVGEGPTAEVETVQWFVPLPDGRHLALLSFSTPNVGLAEPFGKLFDAIAATLSWS